MPRYHANSKTGLCLSDGVTVIDIVERMYCFVQLLAVVISVVSVIRLRSYCFSTKHSQIELTR